MRQLTKLKIAFFLPFFFLLTTDISATVTFEEGDLETIKSNAGEEGKLYFVNFTAKWCAPCKFMEEYTYTDDRLSEYIDDNYFAVKMDINSIDGFGYKKEFGVQTLPAIVVFNSKGEMVGKHETSMSAGKMLFVLEDYDIPANRVKVPKKVAPKPIPPTPEPEIKPIPKTNPPVVIPNENKPAIPQEREIVLVAKGSAVEYTVQVGAFYTYENAFNESERLRQQLASITTIQPSTESQDGFNRLFLGKFNSYEEAKHFSEQLELAGMEAIVKVLP